MTMNPPRVGPIPTASERRHRAAQLQADILQFSTALKIQQAHDADNVLALAMIAADLSRARAEFFRVTGTIL